MKVYIGPYRNWIGPYQIAEKIFFWRKKDSPIVEKLGDFLAQGFSKDEDHKTWFYKLLEKLDSERERKIEIHIDDYDVWGMDHTLAMIIHPMLLKLKEKKHGSPLIPDYFVPEHLHSTNDPDFDEYRGDIDKFHHARWEYIIDEMIWAFNRLRRDDPYDFEDLYGDLPKTTRFGKEVVDISSDRYKECAREYNARIKMGLHFFAEFYGSLWD